VTTPARASVRRDPPSKRQLAAMVAGRLGLLRAIRFARLSRGLMVLGYHRIGDASRCPLDEGLVTTTPGRLAEHLTVLKRWTRIASLDEVEERYASGRPFQEPLSLVTFDDAYRDNYELAFPALQRAGVSGVFFVPTGLIEQRYLPWWDRVAYAIKHSRVDSCTLEYPSGLRVDSIRSAPRAVLLDLLGRYKNDADLDKERYVASIEDAMGARAADAVSDELFATWRQLKEMVEGGMCVGSHTHTHRLLYFLSCEEQREELARSRSLLRERLGVDARSIAYPVGSRGYFNATTRRVMGELGYRLGFSFYGGWNPSPADPYDIRRIQVDHTVSAEMLFAAVACPQMFAV
jgi:peptidoglycan/xylan/chitin deacetylase (PgdA/CDA1 family)